MLYTPFIHTPKDTVAKNENIEYITDGIVRFLGEIKNEAD
jgi:Iap family predicted aminopeptidase